LKRLNKYILLNVVKFLVLTELAGIVMFTTIEFFEHMDIFTSSLSNFLLSIGYLCLRTPYYVNLILPLAFLVSMLTVLILMIRNNEMIIVRTSGISTISLMKPLVSFALVLIVFSFLLAEWVMPVAASASEYMYRVRIKREEPHVFFKNDRIWFKRGNIISNIDFFDNKKDLMQGITILEFSEGYSIKRRLDAQQAVWKSGAWEFRDVTERIFTKDAIASVRSYRTLEGLIKEPPTAFKTVERNPEDMGYKELSKYIARLKRDGHDIQRYLVDLYSKVSFPFINLIMVFAAVSVGLRYVKTKHISKGIFSGISVGILYWFFHSISLSFGYSEIFPPLFAAWFSNILFFSLGMIGVVTLRT
jgi:lipopolysaccharide export system permease protein